jgi:predicted Zn-dependent protease
MAAPIEFKPIEPPDVHYLNAAQGWLGFKNPSEAKRELDHITVDNQDHPEVLEARWQIAKFEGKFSDCMKLSERLTADIPQRALTWQLYAQSYYLFKDYPKAYKILLLKLEEFPKDWPITYDLACYCCLLNRVDEGRKYLAQSMSAGDARQIKRMALEDPDLKVLWSELEKEAPGQG